MIVTYRQVTESDCEMETTIFIDEATEARGCYFRGQILQVTQSKTHTGPYTRVDELADHERMNGCKPSDTWHRSGYRAMLTSRRVANRLLAFGGSRS